MRTIRELIFILALLLVAVGLNACTAPAASPTAPAAGGPPQVTLTTNPDPATGETELVVKVKDSTGKPLTGVKVLVTADMASHSMGAMQGEATNQGDGRYATKVPFGMAGDWKVTIEVHQGDTVLAAQDFVIPVQ